MLSVVLVMCTIKPPGCRVLHVHHNFNAFLEIPIFIRVQTDVIRYYFVTKILCFRYSWFFAATSIEIKSSSIFEIAISQFFEQLRNPSSRRKYSKNLLSNPITFHKPFEILFAYKSIYRYDSAIRITKIISTIAYRKKKFPIIFEEERRE